MNIKKICAAVTASALAAGMTAFPAAAEDSGIMRDMTTMEIVRDMGLGINLGNTFESCGSWINDGSVKNYETAWGSPVITREMIQGYADEGFGSLRIPVAWSNMMGDDYTINADYLARVKEVSEWAIDSGMYVIVNIHWDGGWWEKFPTDEDECMYKYTRIWTQLCESFGDFSDYMIFESLNEEGGWSSINSTDSYNLLNKINQKFVDIVRASGKNNAKRHLLIAGYNTDIAKTCDERFKMPDDPENRCAVSVHYYTPPTFCILDKDASWGKADPDWGSDADYAELNNYMDMMKTNFVDKGIPVIVGEYGCTVTNKTQENINRFLTAACEAMYLRGMCPVLWDITYSENHSYSFYDRYSCKMSDPDLKAGFAEIAGLSEKNEAVIDVENIFDVTYGDEDFNLNASTTSDGVMKYSSSDENIVKVDQNGNVTIVGTGSAVISIDIDETEQYRPAVTEKITVNVAKIANPPVMPDEKMTVDMSVTSTDEIELPEGWSWLRTYQLSEDGTTVAVAVYNDEHYDNGRMEIEITRTENISSEPEDETSSDNESLPETDGSSENDNSSENDASSSETDKNGDSNPATGAASAGMAALIICGAAALVIKKKK